MLFFRLDAWESFHKIECQQLDLLTGANLGKNAMLAFRILTSSGMIYLEYVVNKVKEELEKPENEGGGPEKVGFNEEGVYDAADYRSECVNCYTAFWVQQSILCLT